MYDSEVIEALEQALDEVCAGAGGLADAESVERLHRCLTRLDAATSVAAAAFDAAGGWEADGARTAAAWLARRCSVPKPAAARRVRLGRALRHLPDSGAAWLAGHIGAAHVSVLAGARTPATEAAMGRDEAFLVEQARRLRFDHFTRAVAYWRHHADPDGVEDAAGTQYRGRRLHLSQSFDGAWFADAVLDPVSGQIVAGRLDLIERELFAADWAEARARLGDAARAGDLARTTAQRRADALVEMAVRAGTVPAGGRRPEPLFTVLVGYETFAGPVCELAGGAVVSPGTVAGWLDRAWVERVVFGAPSRVIDVGVTRRVFGGALRRAIEARDRECFDEYCDVPAGKCQVDHIEPYAAGGLTTAANGRLACGYHNRRRHRRHEVPPRE